LLYLYSVLDLYRYLRPLLFALPPEAAHVVTLVGLKLTHELGLLPAIAKPELAPVSLMGLQFPNRLGLAAGLDKSAAYVDALGALGFGFIEVGTVTPKPQRGNPRPRLLRLTDDRALINRMGFPNDGVAKVYARLSERRYGRSTAGICGVNIGKNAVTPLQDAASDYVAGLIAFYPFADYVAINISSPNTLELRRLQRGELLQSLLAELQETRLALAREFGRHVPLLVKLTADLDDAELADATRVSVESGVDGIIATNTTVSREEIKYRGKEDGGLSGAPLLKRALHAVQCIRAEAGSRFPIVGVGGVDSVADVDAMRTAGADLVQVYTGLIYRGPNLIQEILASRISV
jgi:dihydroorotate dehydrogenase